MTGLRRLRQAPPGTLRAALQLCSGADKRRGWRSTVVEAFFQALPTAEHIMEAASGGALHASREPPLLSRCICRTMQRGHWQQLPGTSGHHSILRSLTRRACPPQHSAALLLMASASVPAQLLAARAMTAEARCHALLSMDALAGRLRHTCGDVRCRMGPVCRAGAASGPSPHTLRLQPAGYLRAACCPSRQRWRH